MSCQVSFYSDAADPLLYACRLARRALASGRPVAACVPDADLAQRFDRLLWSFEPTEFLAHRRWQPGQAAVPGELLIVDDASQLPHRALLLNLGDEVPADALAFERVLEIIGRDEVQVRAGRARYRVYQREGARLDHFSAA